MSELQQTSAPTLAEKSSTSVGEYFRTYLSRVKQGDIGALPIILGLLVIAVIFQSLNENYLTPRNFVNLIVQMAGITTIAIGVVFVLLLGEIDLSIGYVSAVAAVFMTLRLRPPDGWHWLMAIGAALLFAAIIGLIQGSIITQFRLPSFVVTLAGLMVWNGVVLILIGNGGTVIIQDNVVIGLANHFLTATQGWILAIVIVVLYTLMLLNRWRSRQRRDIVTTPIAVVVAQIVILAVITFAAVYVANLDRGVPFVGVILLLLLVGFTFLAERMKFGRYVYAIGGNAESARRAGINVNRIRIAVFMISATMAGFGGIILASRLRSVDTAAGGGDLMLNSIAAAVIGGTSLFGGSGRVISAFLGALVIASVQSGMGLLGLSSGVKFVVTGLVLLAAVLIDAISRRGRARSGIA
ncbi:MAG: ABC transporter permease [Anaerolineae bacterium]|nr:ABC transporter permease [Anaerolineae bacterium]MCO5189619.1 ABC transporter permease [Anaerolineae bacterium]MCO5193751.1 ABC transporter permease [Anaerolineae bacterium]MCO5205178.1 ABC transporter permease [Anaerolineae bacterium]